MKLYNKNKNILKNNHSYDSAMEHDACGVGLIASLNGEKSRKVVEYGIEALKAVWHRGAVDADGKSGDGAGISFEIPKDFFLEKIEDTGHKHTDGDICVGMIFLPRTEYSVQERSKTLVEQTLLENDFYIYGWRQVPVNPSVLGKTADSNRPEITQVIFKSSKGMERNDLERLLYVVRKKILKQTRKEGISIVAIVIGILSKMKYVVILITIMAIVEIIRSFFIVKTCINDRLIKLPITQAKPKTKER